MGISLLFKGQFVALLWQLRCGKRPELSRMCHEFNLDRAARKLLMSLDIVAGLLLGWFRG